MCLGLPRTVLVHAWKPPTCTLKSILLWTVSYMVTLSVVVFKHVCRCFDTLTIEKSISLPLEKQVGFCDCLINSVWQQRHYLTFEAKLEKTMQLLLVCLGRLALGTTSGRVRSCCAGPAVGIFPVQAPDVREALRWLQPQLSSDYSHTRDP